MPTLRTYPPYRGLHTRETVPGALPNGTRVMKVRSLPGDSHGDGDRATVLGAMSAEGRLGYFVEWDDQPLQACLIMTDRCAVVKPS